MSPPDQRKNQQHQQNNVTQQHLTNANIMTSLFSGLPFSSSVFPSLIDMSSTQALVTLVRITITIYVR